MLIKNNCFLDIDNKIKIPQNKEKFFIIEKSKTGKYCIDIIFDPLDDINYINLYLIITSLSNNLAYYSYNISIVIERGKSIVVTESIRSFKLSNTSFNEFIKWLNYRITYDHRYINKDEIYCIRIAYDSKIIENFNTKHKKQVLEYLKPLYPWHKDIIESLTPYNNISEIQELKNKIKELEDELKKYREST